METYSSILRCIYSASEPRNIFSLLVTGGGFQTIQQLFTVPGASNSLIHADLPYSMSSLREQINDIPESYCSIETSRKLARRAYEKSVQHQISDDRSFSALRSANVFGIGCTASLVSSRPKRGPHRCYVSVYSTSACVSYTLDMEKGLRNREEEDDLCSRLVMDAIVQQCGVDTGMLSDVSGDDTSTSTCATSTSAVGGSALVRQFDRKLKTERLYENIPEKVTRTHHANSNIFDQIRSSDISHAVFIKKHRTTPSARSESDEKDKSGSGSGVSSSSSSSERQGQRLTLSNLFDEFAVYENPRFPQGTIVYPGSFNPIHDGHLAFAAAGMKYDNYGCYSNGSGFGASSATAVSAGPDSHHNRLVVFEISIANADKPMLSDEQIMRRLESFDPDRNPAFKKYGIVEFGVCINREPLFVGKAQLYEGCTFLIGADTFARIIDPKYYGASTVPLPSPSDNNNGPLFLSKKVVEMMVALAKIASHGCRFLVAGRVKQVAKNAPSTTAPSASAAVAAATTTTNPLPFETMETILNESDVTLLLPQIVKSMLFGLSESQFRLDMSSSELRRKQQQQQQEQQQQQQAAATTAVVLPIGTN